MNGFLEGLKKAEASRLTVAVYMGVLAQAAAMRGTCPRRAVGAVASYKGTVVGTGYNGSPPGLKHCTAGGCLMVGGSCIRTTHAEVNCLAQCGGRPVDLVTCTTQPCLNCCKALLAYGVPRVHYLEPYPSSERDTYLRDLGLLGGAEEIVGVSRGDWMRHLVVPRLSWAEGVTPPTVAAAGGGWAYDAERKVAWACAGCNGKGLVSVKSRFIGEPSTLADCEECQGSGEQVKFAPYGYCAGLQFGLTGCPHRTVFLAERGVGQNVYHPTTKAVVVVCRLCLPDYQTRGWA